jgi:Uncharacterized protein conserved in bacteria N-term (DUF3322)
MAGEPWVASLLDEMTARSARGEAAYRLTAAQAEVTREFFTLLASISRSEARGLDARTFSFRAANDTKAFDRHASRLAALCSSPRIHATGASRRYVSFCDIFGCYFVSGDRRVQDLASYVECPHCEAA